MQQLQKVWLRTTAGLLGAGLTLTVVGITAFDRLTREWIATHLIPQIEQELTKSLKHKVTLGDLEVLLPWEVRLGHTKIEGLGEMAGVGIGFSPWDLPATRPIPLRLHLKAPDLLLGQKQDGRWEVADLWDQPPQPEPPPVVVEYLAFEEGRVLVRPRASRAFTLTQVKGALKGTGELFRAEGRLEQAPWSARGEIQGTKRTVRLAVEHLPFQEPFALLNLKETFRPGGKVTGQVQLTWNGKPIPRWDGELRLEGGTAQISGLGHPLTALSGRLVFRGQEIRSPRLTGRYGALDFSTQGNFEDLQRLNLAIHADRASFAQLQKTFGVGLPVPVQGAVQFGARLAGPLSQLVLAGAFASLEKGTIDQIPLERYQGRVRLQVNRGLLDFPEIHASILGGAVAAQGRVELGRQTLSFTGKGLDLKGAQAWAIYGGPSTQKIGVLKADFLVQGPVQAPTATIDWRLAGGDWPGAGRLVAQDNQYALSETTFSKWGGQLQVSATMVQNSWKARIDPVDVQLEQLFPTARVGLAPLRGPVAGTIQTTGQWGRFALSQIRAQGNVSLPRGFGLVAEPITNAFTWDSRQVRLDHPAPTPVQVQGTVEVRDDLTVPVWNLRVMTHSLALGRLKDLGLPLPVAGQADLVGQLTGSPRAPEFESRGAVHNLRLAQVAFPDLQGLLHYRSDMTTLDFAGRASRIAVDLSHNQPNRLALRRGTTVLTGIRQGDALVGTLADLPAQEVLVGIGAALPPGLVGGRLGGDYRLSLTGPRQFQGQIALTQGRWGSIPLTQAQADLTYHDERLSFAQGTAILALPGTPASHYRFSGSLDTTSQDLQAKLATTDGTLESVAGALGLKTLGDLPQVWAQSLIPKDLGRANQVSPTAQTVQGDLKTRLRVFEEFLEVYGANRRPRNPRTPRFSGQFQGQVTLTGKLTHPQIDFELDGQSWRLGQNQVQTLQTRGSYHDQALQLDQLVFQLPGPNAGSGSFEGVLGAQGQHGTLMVKNFPAQNLQSFVPPYFQVQGDLSLKATLSGPRTNPTLRGEFEITNGSLNQAPLKQARGGIGYREGRLSLLDVRVATGEEPAYINGSFPFPVLDIVPQDKRVRMQLAVKDKALGLMNLFTDQIQWQGGSGVLDAQIGGRSNALTIQGTLQVQKTRLNLSGFAEPLTDIAARITFLKDRAKVEEFTGQLGGGKVTVAPGLIALTGQTTDPVVPLAVDLERLKINLPPLYEGDAQGRLLVSGTVLNPTFGGRVILENGRFGLPERGSKPTQNLPSPPRATVALKRIDAPALKDLQVVLGDRVTLVQAPFLRVDTRGELVLKGTLDNIQPEGEVQLVRGRLELFSTAFFLDNSWPNSARFRPSLGLDPELNLRADARATEVSIFGTTLANPAGFSGARTSFTAAPGTQQLVRISARVSGRSSKPEVDLRSSPPRSQDEIVTLLGGGSAESLLLGTGASFVSSPLFNRLEEFFLENVGLDEFRISPTTRLIPGTAGAFALGVGLEVGKDITRELSLSLSQNLTDPSQLSRLSLRYRVNDAIQLRLSTDFSSDVSFSVEYETRF
ncbi:translocation/assembly module TamB domain-containing protein [Anthocerotibacter panamensis]|uniref:translocation/assembly module TamB domain-containing protein n=1 Tax=Anthocerotibacter panamensis TaxID=2857077 RepID=UPI001C408C03|nr:translocation/assembly module TamB [Anthocerotibacter panamensis]